MSTRPPPNPPQPPLQQRPERPPSPWLRKYGGRARPLLDRPDDPVRHSGLAPRYPELHETYYAGDSREFDMMSPFPRPVDDELDKLFASERTQIESNSGLTTWEIGLLGEYLINDWPGGHGGRGTPWPDALEHGYGVKVDENAWHPVFTKDKWYDFRVPILNDRFNPPGVPILPTDVWSVDVPRVWKELRVCLELTNRWLRHMATGLWLNHMMYEQWEEWMEAKTPKAMLDTDDPNLVGPNNKPWRIPAKGRDYDSQKTLRDIENRLAGKLIWTFVDDGHQYYDSLDEMDLYGRTLRHWDGGVEPTEDTPPQNRPAPYLTIYIHVHPLRVLLNPASTLSERFHARWSLAMTMLHELMHAINFTRHLDEIYPPWEPYYNEEWDSELGRSGIKSFFGSDFDEAPQIETAGKSGYKYGMATTEWPAPPGNVMIPSINDIPTVPLGHTTTTSPLPSAWTSSTLLESFYNTVVQKYGLAAFEAPKLFSARRVHRGFYTRCHRARLLHAATSPTLPTAVAPGLAPAITKTLAALQARRQAYARLRPWYEREHRLWQLTPYSHVAGRAILARFAAAADPAAIAADPLRAEREAHLAASGMYYYLELRPRDAEHDAPWPRALWFWAVMALMMQAALPRRPQGTGYEYPSRLVGNVWFPSQRWMEKVREDGRKVWRFEPQRTVYEQQSRVYMLPERHMIRHKVPLKTVGGPSGEAREGEEGEVEHTLVTNRMFLLERALKLKQTYEQTMPLPAPLGEEVQAQLALLFDQTLQNEQLEEEMLEDDEEPQDPRSRWLEWQFRFPEYSSQLVTRKAEGEVVTITPWAGSPVSGDDFEFSPPPTPGQPVQARVAQVLGERRRRRRSRIRLSRPPTRYFTVSEVGEKMSNDLAGTNWALLLDQQGEYDVFDISEILRERPDLDFEKAFERTQLGRRIVSLELMEALQAKGCSPVGKLLTWKHLHEVLEHDGQDGRELWCVVGSFVYNITDFSFDSEEEKQALLGLMRGNNFQAKDLDEVDMPVFLSRLAPYRCGYLRQEAPATPRRQRTFTLRELGRYIFPEIGMYCAIDGEVYDLGRYLHSHPGGAAILRQYAGRDATAEFQEAHSDWTRTLKSYSVLKVGRIVEERSRASDIDDDEIVLLGRIFRISRETVNDDALFERLAPYTGGDATAALKNDGARESLSQLLGRDDLICAKLARATRRQITPAELRKRSYLPRKAERQARPRAGDKDWRAWVSAAEEEGSQRQAVYDVTLIMMFGDPELEQELRPWLGKTVRDERLADVLRTHYGGFVIGELVGGGSRVGAASARKAQVLSSRPQSGRQSIAGLKRRMSALEDSDGEFTDRSKRFRARSWR